MPDFLPSEFMQKTDNLGSLARKNKFTVEIIPPKALMDQVGPQMGRINRFHPHIGPDSIEFLASAASLPGKTYSTTPHRIYGFSLQVPYEASYEPVQLTFMNTNDYLPRTFFEDWMSNIARIKSYNMQYRKDYIGNVFIHAYDDNDVKRYSCKLVESWPIVLSPIELSWDGMEVQTFTVDIRYSWWISDRQSEDTWKDAKPTFRT